jgi:protein TonB
MGAVAANVRTSAFALAVALTLHGLGAVGLSRLAPPSSRPVEAPVEIDVRVPPPPLAEAPLVPPPAPVTAPPEPVKPRVPAKLRAAPPEPVPSTPAPPAAPPPHQEPPPVEAPSAPPVFGVTASSVVAGEAPLAVAVGNTVGTKSHATSTAPPRPLAATGGGGPSDQAGSGVYIATYPRVLHEVNSADNYPPDAKALGLEGKVRLKVNLDAHGTVVDVRVIERAGHGFDEAAIRAMRQFRFSPALTSDGRAVPYPLVYQMTFSIVD